MKTAPTDRRAAAAQSARDVLAAFAIAAPWALYLPHGLRYTAYLGLAFTATFLLWRTDSLAQVLRQPLFVAALALWCWLLASLAWTSAARGDAVAHLWSYSLLLWVVPVALACRAADAARALRHFVVASSAVAGVWIVEAAGAVGAATAWLPFVDETGNRRIALSLLVALGAAQGTLLALDASTPRARWAWALGALLCAAGVALQDRRSGMVTLPAMLLVLAAVRQPTWPRRLGVVGALAIATAVAWTQIDTVRDRFAEGVAELRDYRPDGDVATSWGMRLRMYEVTATMVSERPIAGHGVGSWVTQWRARVQGGKLGGHTAPHSEYLLVAAQGGTIGLGLLLAVLGAALHAIQRAGPRAHAALLVLVTLAVAGLFNVVLRDAKFAVPLLTLAALAGAAATGTVVENRRRRDEAPAAELGA